MNYDKLLEILANMPPLWRGIAIALACACIGICTFFLTACGNAKVLINQSGGTNDNKVEVNAKPSSNTSISQDSTFFSPSFYPKSE